MEINKTKEIVWLFPSYRHTDPSLPMLDQEQKMVPPTLQAMLSPLEQKKTDLEHFSKNFFEFVFILTIFAILCILLS